MAENLKRKFILVVMLCFTIILTLVVGFINGTARIQMKERYTQILELLIENEGKFPEVNKRDSQAKFDFNPIYDFDLTQESEYEIRYFVVYLDKNKKIKSIDTEHITAVSVNNARSYAEQVLQDKKNEGSIDYFRYLIGDTSDGYLIAFADTYQSMQNINSLSLSSIYFSILLLIFMLLLLILFSGKVIRPVVDNINKQKRFITDAGHELKTPLAVISADTDVIELTHGSDDWTKSIKSQIVKLNELINHMLYLSKMEEGEQLVFESFDLTALSKRVVERLEPLVVRKNSKLTTDIKDNIVFYGDEKGIEQLISVLVDNAAKYCKDEGEISVVIYKAGRKVHIEVRNSGHLDDEKNSSRLFDRFYRPDKSRNSETGGHGIGLSIARAITTSHKGTISAKNEGTDKVLFNVILPSKD